MSQHRDESGTSDLVEIRGVDSVEDAGLEDIWIAGQPLGVLVANAREATKQNARTIEELKESTGDVDEDLVERVDALEKELDRAAASGDEQKASKLEKIEAIIRHACSKDKAGVAGVQIEYGEVIAAAGCSRQWAHTLMDEIGAKYDFASVKSPPGKKKQLRIRTDGRSVDELIEEVYETENGG